MTQQLQKLINNFFRTEEFFVTDMFGHKYRGNTEYTVLAVENILECVPDVVIETLAYWADQSYNAEHNFNVFLKNMSAKGYMSFTPYIHYDSHSSPTLVLKYNRYLHVMKGSYFQVSYSGRGHGTYQSSNTHFDIVSRNFKRAMEDYAEERDLSWCEVGDDTLRTTQILFYMTAISAASGISQFDSLLEKTPGMVDEFVAASWSKFSLTGFEVKYSDLTELLTVTETPIGVDDNNVYRVKKSETMDFCRVMSDKNTFIQIDVPSDAGISSRRLQLPDCEISKEVFYTYLGFAFNQSGFVCNSMVTYPVEASAPTFKALNNIGVREFVNICSIQ